MTKEANMNKLLFLTLALGVGVALSGCGNTLSGAKQDAANDTQKTQQAAADAAQSTKDAANQAAQSTKEAADKASKAVAEVPQDIGAATVVTPEVKTAILRDPILNNPSNLINVNSHDHVVVLTGHVMDASMKQRATEDTQNVLNKRHGSFTLNNNLTVAGAQ